MSTRIIVEQDQFGHWSAWFADAPHAGFGGDWPSTAIERLLDDNERALVGKSSIHAIADPYGGDRLHLQFLQTKEADWPFDPRARTSLVPRVHSQSYAHGCTISREPDDLDRWRRLR